MLAWKLILTEEVHSAMVATRMFYITHSWLRSLFNGWQLERPQGILIILMKNGFDILLMFWINIVCKIRITVIQLNRFWNCILNIDYNGTSLSLTLICTYTYNPVSLQCHMGVTEQRLLALGIASPHCSVQSMNASIHNYHIFYIEFKKEYFLSPHIPYSYRR